MTDVEITGSRVGPLHVRTAGPADAPAVVFLHGIGSCADAFDAQLRVLGARFRCLAPDALGYARSDDPPTAPGLDGYVRSVLDLLDRLDVARCHLVGVSWGGVIAAAVAATAADRVDSLVLADTSRGSGVDPARAEAMRARGDELDVLGAEELARRRAPRLLSERADPSAVERVAGSMAAAIRNPGYRWAAEVMAATDHTELLATLTVPTLVVVGADDVVCPPEEAQRIAALVPDAGLRVIPGAGHLANQERPEDFARAVTAHLDRYATERRTRSHRVHH